MRRLLGKLKGRGTPLAVILLVAILVFAIGWWNGQRNSPATTFREIVLLVPDELDPRDPYYRSWADALREEGYVYATLSASEAIRASAAGTLNARGLIMPDTFHRRAGVALLDALQVEVMRGSHLMLVFDAALATPTGFVNSPLKLRRLAGVDYALYENEGESQTLVGNLTLNEKVAALLRIPPGRMQRALSDGGKPVLQATAYGYGTAAFSYFATRKAATGSQLVHSGEHILANLNQVGQGLVLFVNLPLGYLKKRTDGIWLHSFLRYFGDQLVRSPRLMSAPDAVGGIVVNWHIDDRKALGFLPLLDEIGFGDWGPYSIHLTAGPDTNVSGDGLGMDLPNNPKMHEWVHKMAARGNSFGSHGGWIHNAFSIEVTERSRRQHQRLIDENIRAVTQAVGAEIKEYSAPSGNHPQWTTDLLEEMGIRAYYTTGNAGMGPTRSYLHRDTAVKRAWSFPISALGQAASFEEANDQAVPNVEMLNWLNALSEYCVESRAVRLFYFHPIGVSMYKEVARSWLRSVRTMQSAGVFRMYTMSQMAEFLDRREAVTINMQTGLNQSDVRIELAGAGDLAQQVLALPKSRYKRLELLSGTGTIKESKDHWMVHAGTGNTLRMKAEESYD
jgi:Polysaccharide deacetylase